MLNGIKKQDRLVRVVDIICEHPYDYRFLIEEALKHKTEKELMELWGLPEDG